MMPTRKEAKIWSMISAVLTCCLLSLHTCTTITTMDNLSVYM